MAIEVFMRVAWTAAAHSNLHFLRRAIYSSSWSNEECHPERRALCDFDDEVLRLSLSDSLGMTRLLFVVAIAEFFKGNCRRARVVTPLLRRVWRIWRL